MATQATQLYHIINLWLSITRHLHEAADSAHPDRFGAEIGDLLIRASIYLGTIEGHPMTAAKIASHIGIPRPTVVRRLRALERRGVIQRNRRRWSTSAELLNAREQQDFSGVIQMVRAANEKLAQKN